MDKEKEQQIKDLVRFCIDNFDSETASKRIVSFLKDEIESANIHW